MLLVTDRWEVAPKGLRLEDPGAPRRRPAAHRVNRRAVAAERQRRSQTRERPQQRGKRPEAPAANPTVGGKVEYQLVGQVLAIFAVLALSFLIELFVLGGLRHDRDQAQLAALFRIELAQGHDSEGHDLIAPVGPFDDAGKPLASGTPVALLEIPRLNLREVIVEGTSSETLMSGPGHRRDTPLPGQVGISVIAGRRTTYGRPFGSLGQLHKGDHITATTGQGKNLFTVIDIRRAGDLLPPTLTRGHSRLTLVTTDGPSLAPTGALWVDTDLISDAQPRPPQLSSQAVPLADAMMAGDISALWGVVGWSVLLVAAAIGTVWVRFRAGRWQGWVIGVPVLITFGLLVSDDIAAMLPNLL